MEEGRRRKVGCCTSRSLSQKFWTSGTNRRHHSQAPLAGTLVSPGKSVKQCVHVYQCSSQMHQCVPVTASWLHVGLGLT